MKWTAKVYLLRNMQTLMLPSILRLVSCRRSSSSGARGPSRCSNASDALERFSNSVRHLFRSSKRKVQGLFGGSKFGASSESLLHNCAYIELYFGSSRALSKIWKTKKTFIAPQSKNLKTYTFYPQPHSIQFNFKWWRTQSKVQVTCTHLCNHNQIFLYNLYHFVEPLPLQK